MGAAARALRERLGRRGYLLLIAFASRLPLRAGYALSRRLGRVRLARLSPPPWTDARVVRALGGDAGEVERWARRAAEIRESEVLESYLTPRSARAASGA